MKYHNIERISMTNGAGLRTVLWVSGCEHHCKGCQNPCTWDPEVGVVFDENAENELMTYLSDKFVKGVTFSGGDPLHPANRDTVGRLATRISNEMPDKDIWLYTGYTWDEVNKMNLPWLERVDVIVEGKFELDKRNIDIKWRGSSNQNVVDVKESIKSQSMVLYCD